MQDSILEALFAVVIFFFPAVPAFGPYITGLMDKRNVESSRGITTWKQYNDCLTAFKKPGFKAQSGTGGKSKLKET